MITILFGNILILVVLHVISSTYPSCPDSSLMKSPTRIDFSTNTIYESLQRDLPVYPEGPGQLQDLQHRALSEGVLLKYQGPQAQSGCRLQVWSLLPDHMQAP